MKILFYEELSQRSPLLLQVKPILSHETTNQIGPKVTNDRRAKTLL